jgi:hypothetical protein
MARLNHPSDEDLSPGTPMKSCPETKLPYIRFVRDCLVPEVVFQTKPLLLLQQPFLHRAIIAACSRSRRPAGMSYNSCDR